MNISHSIRAPSGYPFGCEFTDHASPHHPDKGSTFLRGVWGGTTAAHAVRAGNRERKACAAQSSASGGGWPLPERFEMKNATPCHFCWTSAQWPESACIVLAECVGPVITPIAVGISSGVSASRAAAQWRRLATIRPIELHDHFIDDVAPHPA